MWKAKFAHFFSKKTSFATETALDPQAISQETKLAISLAHPRSGPDVISQGRSSLDGINQTRATFAEKTNKLNSIAISSENASIQPKNLTSLSQEDAPVEDELQKTLAQHELSKLNNRLQELQKKSEQFYQIIENLPDSNKTKYYKLGNQIIRKIKFIASEISKAEKAKSRNTIGDEKISSDLNSVQLSLEKAIKELPSEVNLPSSSSNSTPVLPTAKDAHQAFDIGQPIKFLNGKIEFLEEKLLKCRRTYAEQINYLYEIDDHLNLSKNIKSPIDILESTLEELKSIKNVITYNRNTLFSRLLMHKENALKDGTLSIINENLKKTDEKIARFEEIQWEHFHPLYLLHKDGILDKGFKYAQYTHSLKHGIAKIMHEYYFSYRNEIKLHCDGGSTSGGGGIHAGIMQYKLDKPLKAPIKENIYKLICYSQELNEYLSKKHENSPKFQTSEYSINLHDLTAQIDSFKQSLNGVPRDDQAAVANAHKAMCEIIKRQMNCLLKMGKSGLCV